MMDIETKKRLDKVYELLFNISAGNFNYRIPRTELDDELEALTTVLNMMSENVQDAFLHQGFVNMHDSYMVNTQALFLLDYQGLITFINPSGYKALHYKKRELLHRPFSDLIDTEYLAAWDENFKNFTTHKLSEKRLTLSIKTKNGLLLPVYCMVIGYHSPPVFKNKILVTFINSVRNNSLLEMRFKRKVDKYLKRISETPPPQQNNIVLSKDDIHKIKQIGEHINHYPEKDILSLSSLALEYGTNEFKLKKGFKDLYGMTVFQFQKNERLRKAHILIQSSDKPLKIIFMLTGFKSAAHFSRVFKERYGYSPSMLRKMEGNHQ